MNIFNKIRDSVYSPNFYDEVAAKPFSGAFKYLLVFALLFGVAFALFFSVKIVPFVELAKNKLPELANYFPAELEIVIKNGQASSNVAEPYSIKMPDIIKKMASDKTEGSKTDIDLSKENIFVIDTKDKFDLEKFSLYNATAVLYKDSVAALNDKGGISIFPLEKSQNLTINKGEIVKFIGLIKPFINILVPFMIIGMFVGGFLLTVVKMIYLFFGALIIWLVAKIKGLKLGYKGSYKLGMYLMTGPILLTSLLFIISPSYTFPFFFTILLAISAAINLRKPVAQPV